MNVPTPEIRASKDRLHVGSHANRPSLQVHHASQYVALKKNQAMKI